MKGIAFSQLIQTIKILNHPSFTYFNFYFEIILDLPDVQSA